MLRLQRIGLSLAAALIVAIPASAENRNIDFDQLNIDVPRLVISAKKDAKTGEKAKVDGKTIAAEAAGEESFERRIVVFRQGVSRTRRMNVIRDLGGVPTKDLRIINAVAVVAPKAKIAGLEIGLKALGEVKRVEKDFVQNWLKAAAPMPARPPAALHKVPGLKMAPPAEDEEPAEQKTPWGIARVNATAAWETTRGEGIRVAVVDTGIDFTHPDLKIEGGYNAIDPNVSFKDDNGHGTHVTGTIAAQDNGQGVVGVAPGVKLWGVKVLSASGSGTFADVIEGIQWTVENKMDIANFSLGASRGTEALAEAIDAAAKGGTAIIAAAGNSGGAVGYPAAYPGALAVAASDSSDKVAYFSSRGPEVDIIAPGVDVNSTWMGGGYRSISGTSMACPHAVGLAALAAAGSGVRGIDAIRAALIKASSKMGDAPDEQQGAGMPDAAKLVNP